MANRFDQPYGQQYVSTYAPMPLQALTDLARQKQSQFDGAMDDINKEKNLLKINADPTNYDYRDSLLKNYNNQITGIAEEARAKGWTPEVQSKWLQAKNTMASDPNRLRLEQQAKDFEQYQKDRAGLEAKNEYMADMDDYPTKGSPDKLTPWTFKGLQGQLGYMKTAKELMGTIKPSGYDREYFNLDANGNILNIKEGREEVASQRLQQLAGEKAYQWIQEPAGAQYISRLAKRHPELSKEQLMSAASQYLYDANAEQLSLRTKSGQDMDYAPGYVGKKQAANLTESTESEGINANVIPEVEMDMEFDSKGNLKVPTTTGRKMIGQSAKNPSGQNTVPTEEKDLNKMAKQVAYIKSIQIQHPELQGLTYKATMDAYNTARKSLSNESMPLESVSTDAATSIGKSVARNMNQRIFYVMDGKGTTTPGTIENSLDELGIKKEDLQKILNEKGISGYTQAGPTPGAYYVEIGDRRLMISPDKGMQDNFKASSAVNSARKSLVPSVIKPFGEGYEILIRPTIHQDGKTSWEYIEVMKDKDGKVIGQAPISLEEIRKAERTKFAKSGYLGSQTDVMGDQETY